MKIQIKPKAVAKEHSKIILDLYINKPLWMKPQIDNLVEILCKYPAFMPDILHVDQKKIPFSEQQKDKFIEYSQPYLQDYGDKKEITFHLMSFRRKKSPKYGTVYSQRSGERENLPNDISMFFDADKWKESYKDNVFRFVRDLCNGLTIDFGRLQYYTAEDVATVKSSSIITARKLYYEYIPDLYNITLWGKPYIDFFGREKLLNTPCYIVEEISPELIWMQLSPEAVSEAAGWAALEKIREDVKRYLHNNAFRNPELSRVEVKSVKVVDMEKDEELRIKFLSGELFKETYHKYDLPKFDLSEIQKPIPPEMVIEGDWLE